MIMKAGMVPPCRRQAAGARRARRAGAAPRAGRRGRQRQHQGAVRRRRRPRGAAGQGGHHHRQAGVAVAAITKRAHGFVVAHVEGQQADAQRHAIGAEPVTLKNGDMLELAGTQMQFVQA
jgi:hypothetical protein